MEDKRLNLNQPLLSVRRFSSTVASQKDTRWRNGNSLLTEPPIPSYKPEVTSDALRNPGSVPFVWEHSPGRPKNETNTQILGPPGVPKLPPGRILKPKKQDVVIITEDSNVKKGPRKEALGPRSVLPTKEKFESSKETKKERSDSGDDDGNGEMYMDALDASSWSESVLYNHSASGVLGLESDVKPPRICSTHPKTQDIMMGHFLPAVKAMVSEAPQTPREHAINERPQEVKKIFNWETKKPQLTYGPNFLQFTAHENEEGSDFECDENGNMSYKVCGLLPHFCLRGSIGLLNPVPGLSIRPRLPKSPANRTRAGSSSASFQPARVAVYHKSLVKDQKDQSIFKNKPLEATKPKSFQKLEGSGLYNRLQAPVSERKEVNSQKKGLVTFKELLADEHDQETDPQNPMVEKTLYVDTVHKVEIAQSNSHSSTTRGQSNFKENDAGIFESLHISTESLQPGSVADKLKQGKEMEIQTGFCKDPKIDQDSYTPAKTNSLELPATPPLPKSPSDSWLWRTLPSVSSKNASLRSNPKHPSTKLDKSVQLQYSQGLLFSIPET